MVRAFFDTAAEKKLDFDKKRHGITEPTNPDEVGDAEIDDEAEG